MRIIIGVLLLVPALAWADAAGIKAAKEQFNKGETEYRLSRFQNALGHYLGATELFRKEGIDLPSLSFNVAQCYRQLRYHRKSVFYYELYLSDFKRKNPDKPVPYAAEVQEHISRMNRDLLQAADKVRQADEKAQAGAHADALSLYMAVWESVHEPRMPYYIARCLIKLKREPEARRYLRTHLDEWKRHYPGQPVPYGEEARQALADLDRPNDPKSAATPPTRQPSGTTPAKGRGTVAADPGEADAIKDALVDKPSRWRRVWPWVFAGVGVAGLAAGSALLATRRVDELIQPEINGPFQRVTDDAVAGSVLVGVGGAAAIVSVVLFALPEKEAAPTVAVSPHGFVAGYAGRF